MTDDAAARARAVALRIPQPCVCTTEPLCVPHIRAAELIAIFAASERTQAPSGGSVETMREVLKDARELLDRADIASSEWERRARLVVKAIDTLEADSR